MNPAVTMDKVKPANAEHALSLPRLKGADLFGLFLTNI